MREGEIAETPMRPQVWKYGVAVLVPRTRRRARIAAHDYFEFWIRRVRREIFVRINVRLFRMIDREKSYLIEINRLLQWFHETKTKRCMPRPCLGAVCRDRARPEHVEGAGVLTFLLPNHVAIDLHILHWSWKIALPGSNPMPHHARAQHVCNKFVSLTIPHKQSRTRTAPPVDLGEFL